MRLQGVGILTWKELISAGWFSESAETENDRFLEIAEPQMPHFDSSSF